MHTDDHSTKKIRQPILNYNATLEMGEEYGTQLLL